jgi:hypothetical protein
MVQHRLLLGRGLKLSTQISFYCQKVVHFEKFDTHHWSSAFTAVEVKHVFKPAACVKHTHAFLITNDAHRSLYFLGFNCRTIEQQVVAHNPLRLLVCPNSLMKNLKCALPAPRSWPSLTCSTGNEPSAVLVSTLHLLTCMTQNAKHLL